MSIALPVFIGTSAHVEGFYTVDGTRWTPFGEDDRDYLPIGQARHWPPLNKRIVNATKDGGAGRARPAAEQLRRAQTRPVYDEQSGVTYTDVKSAVDLAGGPRQDMLIATDRTGKACNGMKWRDRVLRAG